MLRKISFGILLFMGVAAFFTKGYILSHSKKEDPTPAYPVTEKKAFVIIVPSYNNAKYVEKNLRSIFSQNYDNFRVIYIDDHSRDETLEMAKELLSELDLRKTSSLIHNPMNMGACANIYNGVHSCHDHEIAVIVGGDDFLAHENVLNRLNEVYADPNVWATYGNYLDYPSFTQDPLLCKAFPKKVIENRGFRSAKWTCGHFHSFYASLSKEIRISDLFYRGQFYAMGANLAFMIPILEMAGPHIAFVNETLYLFNRENPISNDKLNSAFQAECASHIRTRKNYPALSQLPSSPNQTTNGDIVIFSNENPTQLFALLESIETFVQGVGATYVVYEAKNQDIIDLYEEVREAFPEIKLIAKEKEFKSQLLSILNSSQSLSRHVVFASDALFIKEPIDLNEAIHTLDTSKAYGLYFSHHLNFKYSRELMRHLPLPPAQALRGISSKETPFAWQFSAGIDDWNTPDPFSFALHRKAEVIKGLEPLDFEDSETLSRQWCEYLPEDQVGLFFQRAKCALLSPLPSLSKEMLTQKFDEGEKIDLAPLYQIDSLSKEISTNFSFIPRD